MLVHLGSGTELGNRASDQSAGAAYVIGAYLNLFFLFFGGKV